MTTTASNDAGLTSHKVTVLLVDDQPIIGEAVRRMLAGETDIDFHFCKDPNKAIELLKDASAIELGQATSNLAIYLCPAYVRGEAYLMQHDGKAAAAEFQKFIEHRGLVVNFPWGALAHLQLGRAYAMQAYQDFLTLWKDADSELPVLIAAKAEYAKLQ